MITIIDYGMGNLRSVQKGFEKVGVEALISGDPEVVRQAGAVVLPGVGAFADAMERLEVSGLKDAVLESIGKLRPFLGICLGLQLLFERSFEDGDHTGLGVFKGDVVRLEGAIKIPHMGWNQVEKKKDLSLFEGIEDGANFYFVHSYVAQPKDSAVIASVTDYGGAFVSGVAKDNVCAFQFHPEKSGAIGLRILKNFGSMS